jgi:hypothetical protein
LKARAKYIGISVVALPIALFALVAAGGWIVSITDKWQSERKFWANEAQYRAKMAENAAKGQHQWASIDDLSRGLAINAAILTFVISEDDAVLAETIRKRHVTPNPSPLTDQRSEFRAPFHFNCKYYPQQIGPNLFFVKQIC